jgi:hypothetical protein
MDSAEFSFAFWVVIVFIGALAFVGYTLQKIAKRKQRHWFRRP